MLSARLLCAISALLSLLSLTRQTSAADSSTVAVFVGTYTGGDSKGIYRFDLDTTTGKASPPVLAAEVSSPSFLAIAPNRRFLYAVSEVDTFQGKKTGGVTAFAIDPKTGALTTLNAESVGGAGPCHLVVDNAGKNVLVANYGGGSAAVLPIGTDGRVKPLSSFVQHQGSSVDKGRQGEPHAHSINLDKGNRFAFVADLGLDKILVYKFDPKAGTIAANSPPATELAPGSGPRHFAFHPGGKFAYVINELNSTVNVFDYDTEKGILTEVQSLSTLPTNSKGTNYPAEIVVHPSGRFVYGSNRGHDSIAAFKVDEANGKLTPVGHQGTGVKNPRNFAIEPTGKFLLAANQDANTVVVFKINQETGNLDPTGQSIKVAKPVCVRFWSPVE